MMVRSMRRPATAMLLALVIIVSLLLLFFRPTKSTLYRDTIRVAKGSSKPSETASASTAQNSGESLKTSKLAINDDIKYRDALNKPFNFHTDELGPEIIDPIATRTFYMLKTGAEVMWNRLPIHLETTLKRFPNHAIYSDGSGTVSGKDVIDVIQWIPEIVKNNNELTAWRIRQEAATENWGWDAQKVKAGDDIGGWDTDKYKNVPILAHAWKVAPEYIDWFVMVDDDTYILSESLASLLRDKDPSKPWYIGSASFSNELTFAHGGSGIVMSRGAVDAVFKENDPQAIIDKYSEFAVSSCCGDLTLAYPLMHAGIALNQNLPEQDVEFDPFQGNSLVNTRMLAGAWCQRLVSYHHLFPWEIQIMFDRENYRHNHKSAEDRKRGDLYTDFYQDFILPFIKPERQNWVIYAEGKTLTSEKEIEQDGEKAILLPHIDKDDCKKACEADNECLGWEWFKGEKCVLETHGILRGEALNPRSSNWKSGQEPVTSGWMIERIRRSRAAAPCDPLEYDEHTGKYNDNGETSEGWYFRLKEKQKLDSSLTLSSAAHAAAEGLVGDTVASDTHA